MTAALKRVSPGPAPHDDARLEAISARLAALERQVDAAIVLRFCLDDPDKCAEMNDWLGLRSSDAHFALPDTSPTNIALLLRILQRLDQIEALLQPLLEGDKNRHGPATVSKADELRAACRDLGIPVSGDGYIRESHAARLINRATVTLKNWRYCGHHCRIGCSREGSNLGWTIWPPSWPSTKKVSDPCL